MSRIDPVLWLLFGGIAFFTLILVGVSIWGNTASPLFPEIARLLTGFTGAFLGRLIPESDRKTNSESSVTLSVKPPTGVE